MAQENPVVSQFENGCVARHLTDIAKERILSDWNNLKLMSLTGSGSPDPDIIPLCDKINSLPGICTLQSCQGHRRGDVFDSAHLWLWLSENVAARFDRGAPCLVNASHLVERISCHYLDDGKKIASITFCGNERDALEKSTAIIYGFLCAIAGD